MTRTIPRDFPVLLAFLVQCSFCLAHRSFSWVLVIAPSSTSRGRRGHSHTINPFKQYIKFFCGHFSFVFRTLKPVIVLSSVWIANVLVGSLSMNPALLFPWLGYLSLDRTIIAKQSF